MSEGPNVATVASDLEVVDVDRLGAVHILGIGGAGMSAIARILLDRGVAVSGSDAKDSKRLADLRARGVDDLRRPRRREPRSGADRHVLHGHPGEQPGTRRRPGARAARAGALGRAGVGDAPAAKPIAVRRDPRQDHDDLDGHRRRCSTAARTRPTSSGRR